MIQQNRPDHSMTDKILTVSLTPAQIRALFTTPVALIAAPGAGKFISVTEIVAKNVFGTAAYTGANPLEFRYTDGTGAKVAADLAAAFINIAAGTDHRSVKAVTTELTPVLNAAVVVRVPVADPGGATATGVITLAVKYRVVTP